MAGDASNRTDRRQWTRVGGSPRDSSAETSAARLEVNAAACTKTRPSCSFARRCLRDRSRLGVSLLSASLSVPTALQTAQSDLGIAGLVRDCKSQRSLARLHIHDARGLEAGAVLRDRHASLRLPRPFLLRNDPSAATASPQETAKWAEAHDNDSTLQAKQWTRLPCAGVATSESGPVQLLALLTPDFLRRLGLGPQPEVLDLSKRGSDAADAELGDKLSYR